MNKFFYSVLKYSHSQLLDEKLNVGLLFYFPDENKLVFKKPSRFSRLLHIYKDFNDVQLKHNLEHFEIRTEDLNYEIYNNINFEEFDFNKIVKSYFINKDATVFEFSEIKSSIKYKHTNDIVTEFSELFFSHYETKAHRTRKDDAIIIRQFKTLIHLKNPYLVYKLDKDKVLKNSTTEFKFDFRWKNGSLNYIKSLSLDLLDTTEINHKALLHKAIFEALFKDRDQERVDLLLAPPTIASIDSDKAYKKALEILKSAEAEIRLVQDYQSYVDDLAKSIHLEEE